MSKLLCHPTSMPALMKTISKILEVFHDFSRGVLSSHSRGCSSLRTLTVSVLDSEFRFHLQNTRYNLLLPQHLLEPSTSAQTALFSLRSL